MHARKLIAKKLIAPALLVIVLVLAACSPSGQSSQGQQVPVTGGGTATVAAPAAAPTAASTATSAATMAATTAASPTTSASTSGGASANAASQVNLTTRTDAKLGKYLADDKGMTLYIYTKDSPGKSVCEGGCLKAWPALLVAKGGTIQLDGKTDPNLGTVTRSDGSTQVAYKNMPLYYWAKDKQPGDVTGQGVGNVWFVVNPETGQFTGAPGSMGTGGSSSGSGGSTSSTPAASTQTPSSSSGTGYGNSSSSGSGSSASSSSGSSAASAPQQVTLTVRTDPKLGKFLADDKGMTLYIYTKDSPGKSVCEGKCLANWPALSVAKDGKVAIQGMDSDNSKLSIITRSDGSSQVAFNGMPLYYWVKDQQPGDVTGQGVGGVWYVVAP